jgi:hypothetical protein
MLLTILVRGDARHRWRMKRQGIGVTKKMREEADETGNEEARIEKEVDEEARIEEIGIEEAGNAEAGN